MASSLARIPMRSSKLGAGSTVRDSDIGNLDDLQVLLGCQLASPPHQKLGRTGFVDTREFGGKASAKGVRVAGKRRARYTEEFKAEAVQLARSSPERSIRQLAYEIGVADQTLRNWIKQAQIDRGEREGLATQEREELSRLRKENRVLREEREILKKSLIAWCELG